MYIACYMHSPFNINFIAVTSEPVEDLEDSDILIDHCGIENSTVIHRYIIIHNTCT